MARQNDHASQGQMVLPLLATLDALGGQASTAELYEGTAARLGVGPAERTARTKVGRQSVNGFERAVRWAQQRAKLMGLAEAPRHDDWRLTGKGSRTLTESTPGKVVTVWATDAGVALWADCRDAVGLIGRGTVNLVLTSPPYPLQTQKDYGNKAEAEYVDWLLGLAEGWGECLSNDGSLALNLSDTWIKGHPCLSLYQERLLVAMTESGWNLCQRLGWYNPCSLPVPSTFVSVRRIRVKPALEQIYWLSRSKDPYADNRAVLRPYSAEMRDAIRAGGQGAAWRPSGHELTEGAFAADNGGSIPPTLIVAANTASNDGYTNACKHAGIPVHPARFPRAVPEFLIRLLTRQDDLVFDPCAGSGTTAAAAEALGRRWITCDRILEYVQGARFRMPGAILATA